MTRVVVVLNLVGRIRSSTLSTVKYLWLPADLVQLLIGLQHKAEVVGASVRHGFISVGNLADDVEVVSLGFVVDHAVARERADDVVVNTGGLLARDSCRGWRTSSPWRWWRRALCE